MLASVAWHTSSARVAEQVDAEGLNPSAPQGACEFESHPGHCYSSKNVCSASPVRTALTTLPVALRGSGSSRNCTIVGTL